jgi:hypothetical protein
MEQRTLSKWLKMIMIGIAACGLIVYVVLVPGCGREIAMDNPELAYCYYPWLVFIWLTAIPCYVALIFGWRIATSIGNDQSFCLENARRLKNISHLALLDSAFFFMGNIVYLFMGMNHPGIALCSLFVVFAGVAVSVVCAALSHLVRKAADLQEQSDLTI